MSRTVPPLALLAFTLLAPAAASAQTSLAIAPSDARTINNVLGFSSTLKDGNDGGSGGNGGYNYRWQALFPLSDVPAGATIVSAVFSTAIVATPRPFPHSFAAYASATGTLTTASPTNTTALAGLPQSDGAVGPKTNDATAAIRAYLATGMPYAGLVVSTSLTGPIVTWSSPTLTVTYAPVPEPSSLAALAIPVLGLLRRRRSGR